MTESNIDFVFDEKFKVFKFDDTEIFRKYNNGIKNGKGVDFIARSEDKVILFEVKNCKGYEPENKWRTQLSPRKNADGTIDDCFDVEVAKKYPAPYHAWLVQELMTSIIAMTNTISFHRY